MKMTDKSKKEILEEYVSLMKPGYRNAEAIHKYVLESIKNIIKKQNLSIEDLAENCYLTDFTDCDNMPVAYLINVLRGDMPLMYPVMNRILVMLDGVDAVELFPIQDTDKIAVHRLMFLLFPIGNNCMTW